MTHYNIAIPNSLTMIRAANNGALIAVERLQALGEVVPAKSPCGQNCSYVS